MGLATLGATAVLMAGADSAMAGVHPDFYGVYYQSQGKAAKDFRKMEDANVKHTRMALRWPSVQPGEDAAYDWSYYDEAFGDLAAHGVRVLPILYGSPGWAADSGGHPPLQTKKARSGWKAFVRAAVNRYGRGGTYWSTGYLVDHPGKKPKPIKAWQCWNEPNLQHYFKTKKRRIAKYATLLQLTDQAVKSGDRKASVVLGGLVGNGQPSGSLNGWTFLKKLYNRKGARKNFDVAALHPYAARLSYVKRWVKKFHRVLAQHRDGKKPLWITEIAWGSSSNDPHNIGFVKGPQGQKRMLKRAFRMFWQTRHRFSTRRVIWFSFRDPKHGNPRCSFCGSSGLLEADFGKKPAWKGFKSFTTR
jgi:hypothetical protein